MAMSLSSLIPSAARQLNKPPQTPPVSLGTNTDPSRRKSLPAPCRHHRGADRLGHAAVHPDRGNAPAPRHPVVGRGHQHVPVDLAINHHLRSNLQQSVQPGTPTAKARLVTAVREGGSRLLRLPHADPASLTDSRDHLERAIKQVEGVPAARPSCTPLHLRPGTQGMVHGVAGARASRSSSAGYRPSCTRAAPTRPRTIANGSRQSCSRSSGGTAWSADAKTQPPAVPLQRAPVGRRPSIVSGDREGERSLIAEEMPPELAARAMPQPTLF